MAHDRTIPDRSESATWLASQLARGFTRALQTRAAKLGFSLAVIPRANAPRQAVEGLQVVAVERLDVFNQFLVPAGIAPLRHKTIETTDIMLQMVASGRGVAALPRWLVDEHARTMPSIS